MQITTNTAIIFKHKKLSIMKIEGKVKLSLSVHEFYGQTSLRIEFPDGSTENRTVSAYKFGKHIGMTKKLESKWADGDYDFILTASQWIKLNPLIPPVK